MTFISLALIAILCGAFMPQNDEALGLPKSKGFGNNTGDATVIERVHDQGRQADEELNYINVTEQLAVLFESYITEFFKAISLFGYSNPEPAPETTESIKLSLSLTNDSKFSESSTLTGSTYVLNDSFWDEPVNVSEEETTPVSPPVFRPLSFTAMVSPVDRARMEEGLRYLLSGMGDYLDDDYLQIDGGENEQEDFFFDTVASTNPLPNNDIDCDLCVNGHQKSGIQGEPDTIYPNMTLGYLQFLQPVTPTLLINMSQVHQPDDSTQLPVANIEDPIEHIPFENEVEEDNEMPTPLEAKCKKVRTSFFWKFVHALANVLILLLGLSMIIFLFMIFEYVHFFWHMIMNIFCFF